MLALGGCGGGGGDDSTRNVPPPANDEEYVSDIVYCQADGLDLTMDEATNSSFTGLRPAVILIHGGGWFNGQKEDLTDEAVALADSGYVAFTISYRLTSLPSEFDDTFAVGAVYPDAPNDVNCAVNYVFDNAATYNVDTSRIAIFGTSAGGQLAFLTGFRNPHIAAVAAWFGPTEMLSLYQTSVESDRVALYMGGTPSEVGDDIYTEASPLTYVGPDTPPTLDIQGTDDTTVPVEQAQMLEDALVPFSSESSFIYVPGGTHGLPDNRDEALQETIDFLNSVL
jgi:dipeptidyl aminopeptidase/acylaminoacyl peptidase